MAGQEAKEGHYNEWYQRTAELESLAYYGIPIDERYKKEAEFALWALQESGTTLRPGDKMLDLACGQGEHARNFAERTGANVEARDVGESLIQQAKEIADVRKRTKAAVASALQGAVNYEQGNMSNPRESVKKGEKFKVISCMGSSFMYLQTHEDHVQALRNWHELLEPGGKVVMQWRDNLNVGKHCYEDPEYLKRHNLAVEKMKKTRSDSGAEVDTSFGMIKDTERGDGFYFVKGKAKTRFLKPYPDIDTQVRESSFGRVYVDQDSVEHDLPDIKTIDYMKVDAYPVLERMFQEAGFKNVHLVPGEEGERLSEDPNIRMFAVTAEA